MGQMNETQRVIDMIVDIDKKVYQLPSIQRLYVWKEDQLIKLFDSIMSGYPVGAIIIWTPPQNDIRFKEFQPDYNTGAIEISKPPTQGDTQQHYMVLDGQQRLRSLYIGFRGTFDGKGVYLKIDDYADETMPDMHYQFVLMEPTKAKQDSSYVHVNDLIQRDIEDIDEFVKKRLPNADDEVRARAIKIHGRFISTFKVNQPIYIQEIGSKFSYDDVLTVFERVNSGGTKLSKSDLLFSIVTLKIPKMEDRIRAMVEELNNGENFNFNSDFVIKTAFVVFDKRAKYEFNKLRDPIFLKKLEDRFSDLEKGVTSLKNWLENKALIRIERFLPSQLALIPIIDFLMMNDKFKYGPADGSESQAIRQYLYMAFFTTLFSFAADSVLDQIHDILVHAKEQQPGVFPIRQLGEFITRRRHLDSYRFRDEYLENLGLVLNIVGGGVSAIEKKRGWSLENDHIFPRAQMERRNITLNVNDVGNFRLLPKLPNIKKSDTLPNADTEFFGKDDPGLKQLYEDANKNLTQDTFSAFTQRRKDLIREKVVDFLGM
jgi:hypothetical protein